MIEARLGIANTELGRLLNGAGIGVRWASDNYVVLAITDEGIMYISSGVLWDIAGERLTVLDTCNDFNQDYATPVMFLYQDEDDNGVPWRQSVLLQQKYPVPVIDADPRFFEATVNMMPDLTAIARQLLIERGVQGKPYLWSDDQTEMLLRQSLL